MRYHVTSPFQLLTQIARIIVPCAQTNCLAHWQGAEIFVAQVAERRVEQQLAAIFFDWMNHGNFARWPVKIGCGRRRGWSVFSFYSFRRAIPAFCCLFFLLPRTASLNQIRLPSSITFRRFSELFFIAPFFFGRPPFFPFSRAASALSADLA